jgi:hypothetical protein
MSNTEKLSWKARILEELKNLSVTVIYLWVLLIVFALHRQIILSQYQINYSQRLGFALINAVILAKFMWLGEILQAGKSAARKVLWHSTILNSAIFSAILVACHVLEEILVGLWHRHSISQSFAEATGKSLRDILATGVLAFVTLIPFFFVKGLIHIIGKDEMKRLLSRAAMESNITSAKD